MPTNPPVLGSASGVRSVCLVDDHDQLRVLLAEMLTRAGHVVLGSAATAAEGRAVVIGHHPDVAVIDEQLPDGSGIELCRELSSAVPGVSLILYTALVDQHLERDALSAGAHAVVAKSIRGADLLEAIAILGPGLPPW